MTAYDYIVVGSGAGGGTVAARLAEAGMRVLVLEAGGDPRAPADPRLPADYDVPAFHPYATENPALAWSFFVRHYADAAQQARDPKADARGVFYPRAGTLGGCTAHNAMILVRPAPADWDAIAALTGDPSWRAEAMARYWRRLERCRHRPFYRQLARLGIDPTGHGWSGWLSTERAVPPQVLDDPRLIAAVLQSGLAALLADPRPLAAAARVLRYKDDPNDERLRRSGAAGLCYTPLTTDGHARTGARERLLDVARRHPDRLTIELDALAARVLLDDGRRATGVEYLKGARLYRASPAPGEGPGEPRTALAAREVILAGGAFNTPQLLMLSGIGAPDALAAHGIGTRIALAGVGRNLQDRYEVAVVQRMARPWRVLDGARFSPDDQPAAAWRRARDGMYVSNGAALSLTARSTPERAAPDLFLMALLARFAGYRPGYSAEIGARHDYLSWTVLKAYTENRAGEVRLASADPRDPPRIDFHSFAEGGEADTAAVVAGIRLVRRITEPLVRAGLIAEEELPGPDCATDAALTRYVRDTAWGHHASCSCPIGAPEAGGVLDAAFRVHGARGLRVVDASAFPRIPGFFIAGAVYTIGEKAADAILADRTG